MSRRYITPCSGIFSCGSATSPSLQSDEDSNSGGTGGNIDVTSDDKEDENSSLGPGLGHTAPGLGPKARGLGLGQGFEGLMILDEIDAHVGYVQADT